VDSLEQDIYYIDTVLKGFSSVGKPLQNLKTFIHNVLGHIPCEVAIISPHFELLMVNKELGRITGLKENMVLGKLCYDVFGSGKPCPNCPVKAALTTKTVQMNTKKQHGAKRKVVYVEQMAIPVMNEKSGVDYVIEISRDITHEVVLEHQNKRLFMQTVTSLAQLINSRDHSTGEHSARMRDIAVQIGKEMGLPHEVIEEIAIAGILHDIGKIGIPEKILKKPSKLEQHEYQLIQKHPEIGYQALVNISELNRIAEYILYHHEAYDGQGYPAKKRGNEIPLVSRILCVADVYEAITADRIYRKAMNSEQAIELMCKERGNKFDPAVLDAFFKVLKRGTLPPKRCYFGRGKVSGRPCWRIPTTSQTR